MISKPTPRRLIGAHMPTAGGIAGSLQAGADIGCSAVQVFTASPRQWRHPQLADEAVAAFHAARESSGVEFMCAHDSYLINLAAADEAVLERSKEAFRAELQRASRLGLSWVVTHMGASLADTEENAMDRLAASLRQVLAETDSEGLSAGIALETTAGQGTGLGWRFEQLARILEGAGPHARLGVCLDTCHVFVAGYDLRTEGTWDATWTEFDRLVGMDALKLIHANDAKKPLGSRVDRHEHIGAGEIGAEAFARLTTDPRLAGIPIIVETPDSDTMHEVNVARLRRHANDPDAAIEVSVRMFGHYADIGGSDPMPLAVPTGSKVADVVKKLGMRDKKLADLEQHCRFAINSDYVEMDAIVPPGAEFAVLPPVSGG
ncbi:MAG: deoxyribonuclease IV [Armatimonadetes bacterium]|nr:deoxyribonuclease IV [Armatimonadota bacterium]MDE2205548.1 deoxyribonuclease IV [Armatimonadota bacterium]